MYPCHGSPVVLPSVHRAQKQRIRDDDVRVGCIVDRVEITLPDPKQTLSKLSDLHMVTVLGNATGLSDMLAEGIDTGTRAAKGGVMGEELTAGVGFAWTTGMVGQRVGLYPPEEGDRTRPCSDTIYAEAERLPRERIEQIQTDRLHHLLRHVQQHSPFYRNHWSRHGVTPLSIETIADLPRLPLVTKEDFDSDQEQHPLYGTAPASPETTFAKHWQTSGTTGRPRMWGETREDWENGMYLYARSLFGHGVRPGWRAFFAFSYPPAIAFWLAHYAAEQLGCQVIPKGPLSTDVWLRMVTGLAKDRDSVLFATPTFAQRQIEVAAQQDLDLRDASIRILSLAGEPGACIPSTKARLEASWGAQVHDILGSTETSGPILFTCAEQAALAEPSPHLNADYFIPELLDPLTRQPAPDGQPGALCVTALMRFGMPAVRFLLNDWVELQWQSCSCGRTLPLVRGGVRARVDDMHVVNGVNIYPSMVENLLSTVDGLATEYVLTRRGHRLKVSVEAQPECDSARYPNLAAALQRQLYDLTMMTLDVEVVEYHKLPRAEAKSRRSVVLQDEQ